MGCFWGAERLFWQTPGVYSTAVGYAGGDTKNPTYEEVCSGFTNHTEVVLVVFDPKKVSYEELLKVFWEGHDPTQGMRQGNDAGTQYRSAIYAYGEEQLQAAQRSKEAFQEALKAKGFGAITTEIRPAPEFYYAEDYHQQYLGKNPNGYCGLGGTGVTCPGGSRWRRPELAPGQVAVGGALLQDAQPRAAGDRSRAGSAQRRAREACARGEAGGRRFGPRRRVRVAGAGQRAFRAARPGRARRGSSTRKPRRAARSASGAWICGAGAPSRRPASRAGRRSATGAGLKT